MKRLRFITLTLFFVITFDFEINAQCPLTQAIDFTATDCYGTEIHLFDILDGGQAVLIDFFIDSDPCQQTMPQIVESYYAMGCNQHEVFYIEISDRDSDAVCQTWCQNYGVEYPTIGGPAGGNVICSTYQIYAFPTVILIMPNRQIVIQDLWPLNNVQTIVSALVSQGIEQHDCNTYYYIDATANPSNGGTVSGSGTYQQGEQCTVSATPASNFTFLRWTENGSQVSTNANYTFTVTGNRTLVAQFQAQPQNYNISVSANPTNGGTVTGGGTFQQGQQCTVSATPASNFTFLRWTENGAQVSTDADYTFTVTGNRTLVAQFQAQPQNYNISVSANPTNGGTVTGGGTYQQGQQCTVSATPASNFTFLRWTENGSQVSTYADYTFTVTGNRTLVAEFNEIIPEYTITVNAEPTNGGEVSGGGIYPLGATCVLTASPNPDFVFENWTRNDIVVSTSPSFDFEVTRNAEYVAHFVQDANHCTITAIADPFEGGAVSGSGTYELGIQCVLNAFPAVGFEFVNWTTQDGNQVSTNAQFGFTVTSNAVYIAHFRRIVNHYTITASVEPDGAGSVIGAATFDEGDSCTLIAMPNPTYSFVSWTENGIVVSTDDHYTFTVDRDRNLVAVFSQGLFYTISASAGANGTISPEGDVFVEPGEDKTFAMIPNSGCSVQKVVVDGVDIGPVESYTFRSVNSDHTIHVQFSGLGVDDNTTLDLKVYPNPAKESLIVEGENMKRIAVFNLLGVQMASQEVNDNHTTLNIDGLTKGTYILKVEYADGTVGYMRFVAAD